MQCRWLCAVALATVTSAATAQQDSQNELEQLRRRVEQLETQQTPARNTASNAFNPDVSVILQGTAARSSRNPDDYQITGFAPTVGEVAPPRRGLSLGESELVIASNIDPYFRGQLVASLTPDDTVEVEEAFFQTLALGKGFTIKGGRYMPPVKPGYRIEMRAESLREYGFPAGAAWRS